MVLSTKTEETPASIEICGQPIICLPSDLCDNIASKVYEILVRIDGFISPQVYLDTLNSESRITFDLKLLNKLLIDIGDNNCSCKLKVNIFPETARSDKFLKFIDENSSKIINWSFELLEYGEISTQKEKTSSKGPIDLFASIAEMLRKGFKIGLDDYPMGNNTEEFLKEYNKKHPNYPLSFIKIDKQFALNNNFDKITDLIQELVKDGFDGDIVVEGIHNKDAENNLTKLIKDLKISNIIFAQGFALGIPEPAFFIYGE